VTADETKFADVDLSPTKGLEVVKHLGPSTIGIDTIYRSGGKIPEVFLRGCGVPDEVSFEKLENWKCPDPKTGRDLAREIRKYFIPDFSNWKDHDSYQEAFQRLVQDLKQSEATAAAS
jgi:hypothetical protein